MYYRMQMNIYYIQSQRFYVLKVIKKMYGGLMNDCYCIIWNSIYVKSHICFNRKMLLVSLMRKSNESKKIQNKFTNIKYSTAKYKNHDWITQISKKRYDSCTEVVIKRYPAWYFVHVWEPPVTSAWYIDKVSRRTLLLKAMNKIYRATLAFGWGQGVEGERKGAAGGRSSRRGGSDIVPLTFWYRSVGKFCMWRPSGIIFC